MKVWNLLRAVGMCKTTQFIAVLIAGVFMAFTPAHAQAPGIPPGLADEAASTPSSRPPLSDAPRGLPPADNLKPLRAETFPYNNRPLRDPFWTVGYYPSQWGAELLPTKAVSDSEWRIPTSQLKVSGVSRMGSRVMAIVNNELRKEGDIVEISYLGRTFQWKVGDIQADGNVRFDRHQIINDTSVNRSTP